MDSLLSRAKVVLPPVGLHDNFHYQQLSRQANTGLASGETYIAAYIPSKMHQQIFERAVISFEQHYYKSEIEDSQFEKFSRSIRSINTGMEEIRQYYKSQRQKFEYSFCIITTHGNEFLLAACGQAYVIAEDQDNRLHELFSPEEFVDFSEVISGSSTTLRHMFLAISNENLPQTSTSKPKLAYSILLASEGRTELPWLAMTVDFQNSKSSSSVTSKADLARSKYSSLQKKLLAQFSILKTRLRPNQPVRSTNAPHSTPQKPQASANKVTHAAKSTWNKIWSHYINPNPTRVLVIIGLIAASVVIITILLSIYGSNQKVSHQYEQINSLYSQAQEHKNTNDKQTSESELNQVITDISQLSSADKAALTKYASSHKQPSLDDIATNSQSLLDELHNIVRVDSQKLYSEPNFAFSLLSQANNTLYMVSPATGKVLAYNTGNQKTASRTNANLTGTIWLTSSTETNQIFAGSPASMFLIKPDLTAVEQHTSSQSWPSTAVALSSFTGSLYFLAPTPGQIYRFRPSGTNTFGTQTSYIKTNDPTLANATSLAVTSSIYTTTKTGQINQYTQGVSQSFTTANLPKLDNVTQIAYRSSPEMLILFDESAQSFTFLNLQGNTAIFTKEEVVKNTTNITSFSISEKENVLYFVSSDGLFSLPLP
jgi:hypothetical protein